MTATNCSIRGILIILLATLVILLLGPTQLNPLTLMPPKPKLNVHNFPRPPLLEKTPRHLQVKWRDQTIADTKDAYWVLETTHPPSIPSESTPRKVHVADFSQPIIFRARRLPSLCTPPLTRPSANGKGARRIGISNPPTTTKRS